MPIAGGRFPSTPSRYSGTTLDESFMMMLSKESTSLLHDTYRIIVELGESKERSQDCLVGSQCLVWLQISTSLSPKPSRACDQEDPDGIEGNDKNHSRWMGREKESKKDESWSSGGDIILYLLVIEVLRNPRGNPSLFVHDII